MSPAPDAEIFVTTKPVATISVAIDPPTIPLVLAGNVGPPGPSVPSSLLRAYGPSASTPIPASTWTVIPLTGTWDQHGEICFTPITSGPNAGAMQCEQAGVYTIAGAVIFDPSNQTGQRAVLVTNPQTADTWNLVDSGSAAKGTPAPMIVNGEIFLDVGDMIALQAWSSVATQTTSNPNSEWASATRLSVGPKGEVGDTGPTGPQGSQGPIGQTGAGAHWVGAWNTNDSYLAGDAVTYNGSSYLATVVVDANQPPPPDLGQAYWLLIAEAGDPGPPGSGGLTSYFRVHWQQAPGDNVDNGTVVPLRFPVMPNCVCLPADAFSLDGARQHLIVKYAGIYLVTGGLYCGDIRGQLRVWLWSSNNVDNNGYWLQAQVGPPMDAASNAPIVPAIMDKEAQPQFHAMLLLQADESIQVLVNPQSNASALYCQLDNFQMSRIGDIPAA